MKKQYAIGIGILLIGAVIGLCCKPCAPKIAVVNVNRVVLAYPKLSFVQRENALKVGELSQWIDSAQKQIDSEKDKAKKAKMIQQTQVVARQKKEEIQKEYAVKTAELDQEITDIVTRVAKESGCTIVFAKTAVVSGGLDITEKVLDKFKEEKK
ncbi:MAG: OmpH family outer membrane protein [Pseudomonadota bacterium]|nr:OmpH family outer membrane protein [Pseudomonadota bacterium]